MVRFVLAIGFVLFAAHDIRAASPEPRPASSSAGRAQIEAILQSPADLEIGKRDTMTVAELLDSLHKRHRLSIRFDIPSLANMYGLGAADGAEKVIANHSVPSPASTNSRSNAPLATRPSSLTQALAKTVQQTSYYAPEQASPSIPNSPPGSPAALTPDQQLAAQIVHRLGEGFHHYNIAIKVMDGTCWLNGSVKNQQQLKTALKNASETPGVKNVVNGLKVTDGALGKHAVAQVGTTPSKMAAAPANIERPATHSDLAAPKASEAPGLAAPIEDPIGNTSTDIASQRSSANYPSTDGLPPVAATAPISQPVAKPDTTPEPVKECVTPKDFLERTGKIDVSVATIDGKSISVATALRLVLDAFPNLSVDDSPGMPLAMSNATLLDFLVEDDGILITTRLKALTYKETRVYSVKNLKDVKLQELSKVICQSIRPWSWRSRIDELGEQLKGTTSAIPPSMLTALVKSGTQLASEDFGLLANASETSGSPQADAAKGDDKKVSNSDDAQEAAMIGNAVANGIVTLAHTSLNTLEVIHYADPPTGSIRVLPGKLIITQSQAAHREIAELLKQLSDE